MVTIKRDLRTGRTVWQEKRARPVPHSPLDGDIETDVLVVGAGISGAMLADTLSEAGHRIAIIDRRGPVRGSTVASTALLQYEIDQPLTLLSRQIGEENAIRAWRRSRLALDGLAARIRDLSLGRAERRDSLYLAGDMLDAEALAKEGEARRHGGLETAYLSRSALRERFGIDRQAALLGYDNIAADPRELASGFLRAAIARGARLHATEEMTGMDARARSVRATTATGRTIRCRHLVFATGYEIPLGLAPKSHSAISTWAIATVRQPRNLWPEQCFIWEASEPYLYLRSTADGRVICGGEDEDFVDEDARDALIEAKTATLRRKLGHLLPRLDTEIDFAWAGTFGASTTGLPTIGAVPGHPNCWAVMGFGGNGITYSRIGAEIIRSALSGKPDPDADLYAFAA